MRYQTIKQLYSRPQETHDGVYGTEEPPWERTKDYRHLLSPETLARLEAFEAGRPMPPYPEEMNQG